MVAYFKKIKFLFIINTSDVWEETEERWRLSALIGVKFKRCQCFEVQIFLCSGCKTARKILLTDLVHENSLQTKAFFPRSA